jgi:esterase/lipase superfamily enzyme
MKSRAGTVGKSGVNKMLRRIRQEHDKVRLHLIGHSFGGRLVTAAADALDPNTDNVTVTLLQAAFSHNGLASKFDGRNDGFYRKLVSEKRASGPILITHTKNDRAVGVAYPLASRVARQQAAALGDENDPYGGMGRNGAQHTPEAKRILGGLKPVGGRYDFLKGTVYNLKADEFIKDHGDVTGQQVASAILFAIAAT